MSYDDHPRPDLRGRCPPPTGGGGGSSWPCRSGVLAIGVDLTVPNVALPTLSTSLHASIGQLQWIGGLLQPGDLGMLLLPAGLLADRFGRKRLLLGALALFGISSAACAYATSPATLIATRAVLGVGAAIVTTVSLSLLAVLFPTARSARRRPPSSWRARWSATPGPRFWRLAPHPLLVGIGLPHQRAGGARGRGRPRRPHARVQEPAP